MYKFASSTYYSKRSVSSIIDIIELSIRCIGRPLHHVWREIEILWGLLPNIVVEFKPSTRVYI